jgi:hypothetical protein
LVWWSDLCSIGREFDVESNWISLVIQRALGSRNNTLFWKDWWIAEITYERNTMIVPLYVSCNVFF